MRGKLKRMLLTDCDVCESIERFVVRQQSKLDLVTLLAAAQTLQSMQGRKKAKSLTPGSLDWLSHPLLSSEETPTPC